MGEIREDAGPGIDGAGPVVIRAIRRTAVVETSQVGEPFHLQAVRLRNLVLLVAQGIEHLIPLIVAEHRIRTGRKRKGCGMGARPGLGRSHPGPHLIDPGPDPVRQHGRQPIRARGTDRPFVDRTAFGMDRVGRHRQGTISQETDLGMTSSGIGLPERGGRQTREAVGNAKPEMERVAMGVVAHRGARLPGPEIGSATIPDQPAMPLADPLGTVNVQDTQFQARSLRPQHDLDVRRPPAAGPFPRDPPIPEPGVVLQARMLAVPAHWERIEPDLKISPRPEACPENGLAVGHDLSTARHRPQRGASIGATVRLPRYPDLRRHRDTEDSSG